MPGGGWCGRWVRAGGGCGRGGPGARGAGARMCYCRSACWLDDALCDQDTVRGRRQDPLHGHVHELLDPIPQWGSAAGVSPQDCSPAVVSPEPASPADRSGGPRPAQACRGSVTEFPAKRPAGAPRVAHRRRLLFAAAATAAGAVAAALVAVLVSTAGSVRTFRAADAMTGVSGSARLHDTPTGTQIDLTATASGR
jgi:hypothetical protein